MKLLIMQGPNLNLLGQREPHIYGGTTLDALHAALVVYGNERDVAIHTMQSNHEGEIIDALQQARGVYDGIVLNAGAFTHYSYAIRDAIAAIDVPVVEVHISNIYAREAFRHHSVIAPVAYGHISGLGTYGYYAAIDYLRHSVTKR